MIAHAVRRAVVTGLLTGISSPVTVACCGQQLSPIHLAASVQEQPTSSVQTRDRFKACLIDAAGTLLLPSEPTAEVYQRYAARYMKNPLPCSEILYRFRRAYNMPWNQSPIRYVDDGRPFWKYIVQESTGCNDERMFEDVYSYFSRAEAWTVAPGAAEALQRMHDGGVLLAVVSNFDSRLRPLLQDLHLADLFDTIIVSAEVGYEKPNRCIFEAALDALHVGPEDAVHVGDDRRNDIWGARDAGVLAWLWGEDIISFDQLAYRVLHGHKYKQWDDDDDDHMDESTDVHVATAQTALQRSSSSSQQNDMQGNLQVPSPQQIGNFVDGIQHRTLMQRPRMHRFS